MSAAGAVSLQSALNASFDQSSFRMQLCIPKYHPPEAWDDASCSSKPSISAKRAMLGRRLNVRFGSEADMCSALGYVRFGPMADIPVERERPPRGGLSEVRSMLSDHAASAAAFFFLRQPSTPNAPIIRWRARYTTKNIGRYRAISRHSKR